MSVLKPRLWVNVTTSAAWTRPPVGIVRVERALAENLRHALGHEICRLCVWQNEGFVEWAPPLAAPAQSAPAAESTDGALLLPSSSGFYLARPFVNRALRRSGLQRDAGASVASVQPTEEGAPRDDTAGRPQRGDFVLSAGLDWSNQYTGKLYAISRRAGLRFINCCYDLIPVLFPHYCVGDISKQFTEYFMQLAWGSEALVCISRQTQRDYTQLCHKMGAPARPTVVIPLGDNVPAADEHIGAEVRELASRPFILFVSTIERRKNHEVLYRAYHLLAARGLASQLPRLVFVGMPGWGVGDLLREIELDPLTRDLIVQLNQVSDGELNHLYQQSAFCVYPSLYEGWGLPVGEALAMGKAVIASAEGSLPEVGGDLVRYVEPWDVYAWADAIEDWVLHPERLAAAESRVLRDYRPRQWKQTAEVVAELYRELARRPLYPIVIEPGYELSTQVGVHRGASLESVGTPGVLAFGPYLSLGAGVYEAEISGRTNNAVVAHVEVVSGAGDTLHTNAPIVAAANGQVLVRLRFELAAETAALELRCVVGAGSYLCLERVEIRTATLLKAGPGVSAAVVEVI